MIEKNSVRVPDAPPLEPLPELVVGWMLAADLRDAELLGSYREARERLVALLENQFPESDWQMPMVERRTFPPRGTLKPLPLLEIGAEEKLYRRWDFAFVMVPDELEPRCRIRALGVPSSALEAAVLSSNRLGERHVLLEAISKTSVERNCCYNGQHGTDR